MNGMWHSRRTFIHQSGLALRRGVEDAAQEEDEGARGAGQQLSLERAGHAVAQENV